MKFFKKYLFYIAVAAIIALRLSNTFVLHIVEGRSMLPTYTEGNILAGS